MYRPRKDAAKRAVAVRKIMDKHKELTVIGARLTELLDGPIPGTTAGAERGKRSSNIRPRKAGA